MFFEQFENLCLKSKTTPTAFVKNVLGLSSAKVTAWKNGSIPKYEILYKIADYFGVTVGYLFDGENRLNSKLTENQLEMLDVFDKFTDREQIEIIGAMKLMLKEYEGNRKIANKQVG